MVAPGWYPDPSDQTRLRWWNGAAWTTNVAPVVAPSPPPASPSPQRMPPPQTTPAAQVPDVLEQRLAELQRDIARLTRERGELEASLVETRDTVLLQEVGIYEYSHPLDSSVAYKDALETLEVRVQACIKANEAVVGTKRWAINGSEKEGARMVNDFCRLMLRAYNNEVDNVVRTLKPHSLKSAIERLQKMRGSVSKLGASMKIEITDSYHALRVRELELTADYLAQVAEEKERARAERAKLKEEEAARHEYEREQARLEKEKAHYEAALNALRMKGDDAAASEAEHKLSEIQDAIEGVVRRAANVRAGYVYVISNIGSFGERVVKIGMTRRLDPMDRVRELGDASVPFRFDVHAILFSDDAVGLETALHQRFASRRVNLVNMHREFFRVTPREVKESLMELRGDLLSFIEAAEAIEWRQSQSTLGARLGATASGSDSQHAERIEPTAPSE
jgi:hypothetical protein